MPRKLRAFALLLCCALLLTGCFREATPRREAAETTAVTAADTDAADTAADTSSAPADTAVPETEAPAVDADSYFAGSLFIGDSILEGISRYVRAQRNQGEKMLADAKFLTDVTGIRAADLVGDVTEDRILYTYKGKAQELNAIIADMKPSRIFLFLGMNDLAWGYSVDDTIDRYERLLQALQKEFPDTELVVMTVTPKIDSQYLPWYCKNKEFGSPLLNSLSDALIEPCTEKQIPYVDTNAAVRDEKGHLPAAYCGDGYVHLSDSGAAVLIGALENFALQEMRDS